MYTAGDLVLSGIGLTIMAAIVALLWGFRSSLRWGRNAFFSLGLFMIFQGWLQFINFNGGWPADQPPDTEVHHWQTKADEQRIWAKVDPIQNMTSRDWDDYHRCKDLNVCVRRFAGLRREAGKKSSLLSAPAIQAVTETRCVILDGILRCEEYIRR